MKQSSTDRTDLDETRAQALPDYLAFVISTGRCGTQWLAHCLGSASPGWLEVTHEPLHSAYEPRAMLALAHGDDGAPASVKEHVAKLRAQTGAYLECGHPCWSALPYLARQLGSRIRIIHLVRHPVPVALSWLTHSAYQPPVLPHLPEKVLLAPEDDGSRYPEYTQRWQQLSPFEKCLYYWTEVNALALDLETKMDLPWLRLSYEDLFAGDGLSRLLQFLELPHSQELFAARKEPYDEFRYVLADYPDWRLIEEHPATLELAARLGYDPQITGDAQLQRRYLPGTPGTVDNQA